MQESGATFNQAVSKKNCPALLGQAQSTRRSVAPDLGATASATKPEVEAKLIPVAAGPGAVATATTSVQWSYMPAGQPLAAPNPSLKLSANGMAHWPCGAGASPHFAPPAQRAMPSSPA